MSKQCKCAVCLYYTKVQQHLEAIPEAHRPFFEDMYDRLCNAEHDADWARCQLEELAQGMSAGTAETGTGLGLQPASPVACDAPKEV